MGSYVLEKGPVVRRVLLIGLVGVLPLLFWRSALDPFNVPKFAVLVFVLAVVAAVRVLELLQGADRAGLNRLLVPAAAVITPLLLAWLASPYKSFALFGRQGRLQGLIPYLCVVIFGILLADAFGESPKTILWAFALAGGGVAAYSLIQYLQADPFGWALERGRTLSAVSTLGNPNFTGGYLGMALPVAVVLWLTTPKHRKPLGFLTLAIAGALVFTGSQGGWAAGLAGLSVVAGFLFTPWRPRARTLGYVGAAVVAFVLVGVVIAGQLGLDLVPPTATARGYWWRAAGEMSLHSPVVGRGPSSFAVEGIRYRVAEEAVDTGYTFPDDPHSVPLAFLAAGGVLGLAGFVFVAVWAARRTRDIVDQNLIGAAFIALIVAYLTQSLVSIDEVILRMSLWIGLAGLVVARSAPNGKSRKKKVTGAPKKPRAKQRHSLRGAPALIPLAAFVAAVGWWSWGFLAADIDMHDGLEAIQNNDPEAGRAHMESALDFRWEPGYQRTYAGQLADVAVSTQEQEWFEAAHGAYAPFQTWPDVGGIVQHARFMTSWAQIDPAREDDVLPLYRRALSIDDRNPTLSVEAANAYIVSRKPDEAVALLAPLRDLIGERMPEYWGTFGLALAQAGDEEPARAAIERALGLDPDNAAALEARELLS